MDEKIFSERGAYMDPGAESYRRFLNGDKNGMAELIRLYQRGLTLYLNGFTKDPAVAEELAQETFLKLYVRKPHFAGKSRFQTWLYAIGRNLALSYLRREARRRTLPEETVPLQATLADPEDAYLADERRRRVYAALCRLKPEYHQALWLRYFEAMSVREVAAVMRKTEKSAGVLLHRARNALRKELEKEGISGENL